MSVEIERKFLVQEGSWREVQAVPMAQGYLARSEAATVRVRVSGEKAWLTVKGRGDGLSRQEFEYEVLAADARAMLAMVPGVVEKTRRRVPVGSHIFEVDVFEGDNAGLVVAEVELGSPDEAFERPDWLGREVTGIPRYFNSELSVRPFRMWLGAEKCAEDAMDVKDA